VATGVSGQTQAASALPRFAAAGLSSAVTALAMTGAAPWPMVLMAVLLLLVGAGSGRTARWVAART
jgi:hypothetical protein